MARLKVLGLGNVLMGDDGFGPTMIRVLEAAYEFSRTVSLVDLGTPGLDLIPFVGDAETLIIVDTVRGDGAPGEVRLYPREEIMRHLPRPRLSPHDPGLGEALAALDLSGAGPRDVLLIGVIPQRLSTGTGLSPALRACIPAVAAVVVEEIGRRGHPVSRRVPAGRPDIWWEAKEKPAGAAGWWVPCTR